MENLTDWEEVGTIGVDAGLCWIGDPCYILHKEKPYEGVGKSWSDFCKTVFGRDDFKENVRQLDYYPGNTGLGVVVSTGYGDGSYPVLVRKTSHGRIAEVKVVFITEDDEDPFEDD